MLCDYGFVPAIAVVRITMPLAGTNSIFYGDKLPATGNPNVQADTELMHKLGLKGLRTGCD